MSLSITEENVLKCVEDSGSTFTALDIQRLGNNYGIITPINTIRSILNRFSESTDMPITKNTGGYGATTYTYKAPVNNSIPPVDVISTKPKQNSKITILKNSDDKTQPMFIVPQPEIAKSKVVTPTQPCICDSCADNETKKSDLVDVIKLKNNDNKITRSNEIRVMLNVIQHQIDSGEISLEDFPELQEGINLYKKGMELVQYTKHAHYLLMGINGIVPRDWDAYMSDAKNAINAFNAIPEDQAIICKLNA